MAERVRYVFSRKCDRLFLILAETKMVYFWSKMFSFCFTYTWVAATVIIDNFCTKFFFWPIGHHIVDSLCSSILHYSLKNPNHLLNCCAKPRRVHVLKSVDFRQCLFFKFYSCVQFIISIQSNVLYFYFEYFS